MNPRSTRNWRSTLAACCILSTPVVSFAAELPEPVTISLNNSSGDYLEVGTDDTDMVTYRFSGTLKNYPPSLETTGLRYIGGIRESAANLTISDGNGSPITGALGTGTRVHFRGLMEGDGFNSYGTMVLLDGAHWIMEAEADLNFILDGSLFTRQLWVYGDGTGTLEFAEGFVADHTQNGTVGDGIASVRLRNTTFITHHTQSLPVAPRPDGSGGLQINGHMVFENLGGSTWITRTNPQTYTGAVWIGVDAGIHTETDLVHAGITQFSSHSGSYWAANAFQTTADNLTITKSGQAALVFAGETAFLPGTSLDVQEGTLSFLNNPANGYLKASPTTMAGPNLNLSVQGGAIVEIDTPLAEIASLELSTGSTLVLETQPDGTFPLITTTGNAILNGSVILRNSGAYPLAGTPANIMAAGSSLETTGMTFTDETGGNFVIDSSATSLSISAFTGRTPKFFYYQSDGRFVYLGMGDPWTSGSEVPLVEWSLNAPEPVWMEPQPGGMGSWSVDYTTGVASWNDDSNTGAHGRYHVATFPRGLSESDFSDVSFTFAGGSSGSTPVYVIRRGVVINEDWSDGAFDAPGWDLVNDPDIGMLNSGRSDPPMALARYLKDFAWAVAFFHTDHFAAGPEDVLILKMDSFSDVAFNNQEYVKPEVAALHDNPDHQFGHDHAAEISRHYYTVNSAYQIRPSVDNLEMTLYGLHHSGGSTAATLENLETSMGLFRTVGTGTEVETFGELSSTQVVVPDRHLMEDNFIQISIPRSYDASKSPVHRAGTDSTNSIVGISHAHVGVTSHTDANLDYATDGYDFLYLNSYYGQSGTHLQKGDLDNDGDTDAADLALLQSEFGTVHNPAGRMPSLARETLDDLPGTGTPPAIALNETTGQLLLLPNGTPVTAVIATGTPSPVSLTQSLVWSGNWLAVDMGDSLQWMDNHRHGATVPVVLAEFPAGTTAGQFGEVHVGFGSGGVATVPVTSTSLTAAPLQGFKMESTGGSLNLSFGTQPGFSYQLQTNGSLDASWAPDGAPMAGDGSVKSVDKPMPAPGISIFYRIQVQAAD